MGKKEKKKSFDKNDNQVGKENNSNKNENNNKKEKNNCDCK